MISEPPSTTTKRHFGDKRPIAALALIIVLILGIPILLIGLWWGVRSVRVAWFEREAIQVLAQAQPQEDEERQLWFYRWEDGSWILTRFSEECCGDDFDAHVLRTSDAGIFLAPGAHYCGVEGLADWCRHTTSAADFRRALSAKHTRLIPVAP